MVMLCYVMLCYVVLCYVMLCYVMLCYVYIKICILSHLTDDGVRPVQALESDVAAVETNACLYFLQQRRVSE